MHNRIYLQGHILLFVFIAIVLEGHPMRLPSANYPDFPWSDLLDFLKSVS